MRDEKVVDLTLNAVVAARTLLFVPGHRPDRFDKARRSGADIIVLDLEDSVGPDVKGIARQNIANWFSAGGEGMIRINGTGTPWHDEDLAMAGRWLPPVMLPKVCSAKELELVIGKLGSPVLPILETARGILDAASICSVGGTTRVVFGNADLGSELGVDPSDHDALAYARSRVVVASAAAGLPAPIDGPSLVLTDEKAVAEDAAHAAALGFGGKICLHPAQVAVVNGTFTPSAEDLSWAEKVLTAVNADGSAGALNGEIVGKPIVDRARRLVERATF